MRRSGFVAMLAASVLSGGRAGAQQPATHAQVDSGVVVRLQTGTALTVGRLLAPLSRSDSLVRYCRYPGPPCLDPRDAQSMPVNRVRHLDVQHGSAIGKGALIGGIIGGGLGALGGWFEGNLRECSRCSVSAAVANGAVITGAIGAGIGALFGATSLHWKVGPW